MSMKSSSTMLDKQSLEHYLSVQHIMTKIWLNENEVLTSKNKQKTPEKLVITSFCIFGQLK